MAEKLVAEAIAREEAMEQIVKAAQRRTLAEEDHRRNREKIDLKLGEKIKAGFKTGLTAKQIGREIALSIPRVYQLRDKYRDHINAEFGDGQL